MADQSDVEAVLVGLVGAAVYPEGVSAPSVLGRVCRVYRGWPTGALLDRDLAAGHVNITVFPEAVVLAEELDSITGLVEHGLFLDLADIAIIGRGEETELLEAKP